MSFLATCRAAASNLATGLARARRALGEDRPAAADIDLALAELERWRADPEAPRALTALEILRARALAARLSLHADEAEESRLALARVIEIARDCHGLVVARSRPAARRRPMRSGPALARSLERGEPLAFVRIEAVVARLASPGADLRRAVLMDIDLGGSVLTGARFEGAILERARFTDADLKGVSFEGAALTNVDFGGSDLTGASFRNATLGECSFDSARLAGSDWAGARITDCTLRGVRADGVDFSGTIVLRASALAAASLVGARFAGANFEAADFTGAKLGGARLTKCRLTRARLDGASLDDTELESCTLDGASLRGAIGAGLVLSLSSACDTDLAHARLRGLRAPKLIARRASLDRSDLSGAALKRADFSDSKWSGVVAAGADLALARFHAANLDHVSLAGCVLRHADFSGSLVSASLFTGADLRDARLAFREERENDFTDARTNDDTRRR